MKSFLLRTVAVSALMTSPAVAADMALKAPRAPAAVIYDWTGPYVGLNAGVDFAHSGDPSTSASCAVAPGATAATFFCPDIPGINAAGTGAMSGTGFTGGGQVGYNWQRSSWVLGAEADFESFYGRASRSGTAPNTGVTGVYTLTNSVRATWLSTIRGRVGWAVDNVLLYGTGGLAITDLKSSNTLSDTSAFNEFANWGASSTRTGWTVGAGIEWALSRNWTIKAEYLYVHFDSITANGVATTTFAPGYGSAISTTTDLSAHIARAGVNFRF